MVPGVVALEPQTDKDFLIRRETLWAVEPAASVGVKGEVVFRGVPDPFICPCKLEDGIEDLRGKCTISGCDNIVVSGFERVSSCLVRCIKRSQGGSMVQPPGVKPNKEACSLSCHRSA